MQRCPICDSARVVVVLNARPHGFCTRCGARWVQEGSVRRAVRRGGLPPRHAMPAAWRGVERSLPRPA